MIIREEEPPASPPEFLHELVNLLHHALAALLEEAREIGLPIEGTTGGAIDVEELNRVARALNARLKAAAHVASDLEALFGPRIHLPSAANRLEEAATHALSAAHARLGLLPGLHFDFADPGGRILCDPLDLQVCLVQLLSEALDRDAPPPALVLDTVPVGADRSEFVTLSLESGPLARPIGPVEASLPLRLAREAARRNQGGVTRDLLSNGRVRTTVWFRRSRSDGDGPVLERRTNRRRGGRPRGEEEVSVP